jgi:hypothetical protein
VTKWFEGVLLRLDTVGFTVIPRAAVLRELGISTCDDWYTFTTMFKKSWGKKTPRTGKAKYKLTLLEGKLSHIQQTP